jgi:KOW motif
MDERIVQGAKEKSVCSPASYVPSGAVFVDAARLWDASNTSRGEPTIHLPTVAVMYTTKTTKLVDDPAKPTKKGAIELDINTRVEVTERIDPAHKTWQNVMVVSGTHAGKTGWVGERLSSSETVIIRPKKSR